VYSVTELTGDIRELLEDRFGFVWVEGEISNVRTPASGHCYMALKDENAQIRTVLFRPVFRTLKFRPEHGMKVIAQGRIGVYEPRGEYQLVLDYLEPLGVGALALAFEQLKKKLAAEGLFREEIKRRLPFLPACVAVITSPTGAAVRDFLRVVHRRFANIEVTIVPVRVQGEVAAREIVAAIETVNRHLAVDVIVLTRGGGSLEDLWPFNEEAVARAIRASHIPVVSAVGHEIDVTISDLAADLRAPTPSAAAEMLVTEKEALVARLKELKARLVSGARTRILRWAEKTEHLRARLRDPRKAIEQGWQHLDDLSGRLLRAQTLCLRERKARLTTASVSLRRSSPQSTIPALRKELFRDLRDLKTSMARGLLSRRSAVSVLEGKLGGLDPHAVLKRGYSITRRLPDGRVVRQVSDVRAGGLVQVTLASGELGCRVETTDPAAESGDLCFPGLREAQKGREGKDHA
jgi:exodeoxyribonuclease VII large subunit